MTESAEMRPSFNTMVVGQSGRLQYEALLFVASLRHADPGFPGRVIVAEPQPGGAWPDDPRMAADIRAELAHMGAEVRPFTAQHFGAAYPNGNKIEALSTLPADEPFVFFDTDTLVTGPLSEIPFDFARPSASMRRTATWPKIELYGPGYNEIWESLYARFGLDFPSSLDLTEPDEYWERYLYFNAGWFFGADPAAFGARFLEYALEIRDNPPEELVLQSLDPWLDQVALPLVVHSFGGGRPGPELAGLDGDITCHWRVLALAYAREAPRVIEVLEEVAAPNRLKKLLKRHPPVRRMVFHGRGQKLRAMLEGNPLPANERALRNFLRREGFWIR